MLYTAGSLLLMVPWKTFPKGLQFLGIPRRHRGRFSNDKVAPVGNAAMSNIPRFEDSFVSY